MKEARVSLNAMRRQHLEKVRQQEEEQSMLARIQMEQKLALMRQQKNEQLNFQRELEQRRRDELEDQETRRQQLMQEQLEMERSRLKMKEQQLIQQQFGTQVVPGMQQVTLTDYPSVPQAPPMEPVLKGSYYTGMYEPSVPATSDYLHSTTTNMVGESSGLSSYRPPSYSMVNLQQPSSLPPPPPPSGHTQLQLPNMNPQPSSLPPSSSYTQFPAPLPPTGVSPLNAGLYSIAPDVTNPLSNASTMMHPPPYQPAVAPTAVPPMNYGISQPPVSTTFNGGYLGAPADMQYNQPHPPPQQQVPPLHTSAPPNMYAPPPNHPAIQEAELISFD